MLLIREINHTKQSYYVASDVSQQSDITHRKGWGWTGGGGENHAWVVCYVMVCGHHSGSLFHIISLNGFVHHI